jgi:Mg2+-importing ATPase
VARDETPFWSSEPEELFRELKTTPAGLSTEAARRRLEEFGANRLRRGGRVSTLTLLLSQFRSPIIILLLLAAILSFLLRERTGGAIILVIIFASGLLGFWQERGATRVVERLLALVQVTATVLRDGAALEVPLDEVVPGDLVILNAGAVVPGDGRLLESRDLFVNEAALTGEAYPVEKEVGTLPAETPLGRRTNVVLMGTNVISGEAKALIVHTGRGTEFGGISNRLRFNPPQTSFERGVHKFGYFLLRVTSILVAGIFVINVALERPVLEAFLFALALAVGLTPQLLPAIISVNLAHGARRMAGRDVVVKRLSSIQNFGSMNVLCSDKTGTLTEGVIRIEGARDIRGGASERVLFHAYLNAALETGYINPFDAAIRAYHRFDLSNYRKLDEIPYDFTRKRLSILVEHEGSTLMVTKGAIGHLLDACTLAERPDGTVVELAEERAAIEAESRSLGEGGYRALGVAIRELGDRTRIGKEDESGMTFLGVLAVFDPPKSDAAVAIAELAGLGISLKVISGDSAPVVRHLVEGVGLGNPEVVTGAELQEMPRDELERRVRWVQAYAEIEPDQKEELITALQAGGDVVGYIGDGINDAPAIRAADVGISVEGAVDVAKEAADIVLLQTDLGVLAEGVREGRRTFVNTMKYVYMATSANFGNMFSMAGASLFLPFLPLLPGQILLTNLLTDFPEMTIAADRTDPEMVEAPRRWDIHFIRRFMLNFGVLSSVFDYLTFGVLLLVLRASVPLFRAGWFMESVVSAAMIVLVIRSRRPFYRSRPGRLLALTTVLVIIVAVALPYSPLAGVLGFAPLPPIFLAALAGILVLYVAGAELVKRHFYRRAGFGGGLGTGPVEGAGEDQEEREGRS